MRILSLTIIFIFATLKICFAELEIKETKFNFGEVEEKNVVEHVFTIRNISKTPVEILSVTPDCGCTVADFSKRIEPGEIGYVKLVFDTKGYKGKVAKSAVVKTTDDNKKEFLLVLEGQIKVPIDVSSRNILFYGQDTKGQKKVITIKAQKNEQLNLKFLRSSLEGKISHVLKEEVKGREYKLELVCLEGPEADFFGEISFSTNYKEEPELKIMVRKMAHKR